MDTPALPTLPERTAATSLAARRWLAAVPVLALALLAALTLASDPLLIGPTFRPPQLVLGEEVDTLIVGASHAACAFDPAAFGHARNVARHGELMVSTQAKLVALLDANPGVRSVLMACSPIHVAAWQDEHLLGGTPQSRAQIMEYYPLYGAGMRASLPVFDGDVLLARLKYDLGVPFDVTDDLALYVRRALGRLKPEQYRFWGGFTPLDGSHLDPELVQRVVGKYFRQDGAVAGVSVRARQAVLAIAEQARERGVRLVIVDTPAHARFRAEVPERHRAAHAALLAELAERFPEVTILRDAELDPPDAWFLDPDHLNRVGSAAYSASVAARIATGR